MSTLSKPTPSASDVEVRAFLYAEVVPGVEQLIDGKGALSAGSHLLEENTRRREQTAYETGKREGGAAARAAFDGELVQTRERVAEAITAFGRERQQFYDQIEPTIVNLALTIARKILHREAQVDPMLLAGMVRVALQQIEFSTQVTVRIHPALVSAWHEYFQQHIDSRDLPELIEDPALDRNRCVLETHLGKTELGWEVQFKEIEQGLLDLLAQRPPNK